MIGLAKMGKWRENARVRLAWGLSLFSREIFFLLEIYQQIFKV